MTHSVWSEWNEFVDTKFDYDNSDYSYDNNVNGDIHDDVIKNLHENKYQNDNNSQYIYENVNNDNDIW